MQLVLPFIRTSPLFLVFGLFIGFMNYRNTERFRRITGKSPWGIHPLVWGLTSVFISLFVTLLAFIAMSTSQKRRMRQGQGSVFGGGGAPGPSGGYPGRYPGQQLPLPQPTEHPSIATTQTAPPALSAPPSWLADPSERFDFRYWNGEEWTEFVSKGGVTSNDPF
jgi:Protein of unknown function (DUF2510)